MRLLSEIEASRAAELSSLGLPLAFLELTQTGHKKSIMDATDSVRRFLAQTGLHDYQTQSKGEDSKRIIRANLVRADGSVAEVNVSLYRPQTKDGDPRIWVYGLKDVARPSDVLCLALISSQLWVIDLTEVDLVRYAHRPGRLEDALAPAFVEKVSIVDESARAIADLHARGFIAATGSGSTMVGRVLETALGIQANSKKAPDYRGIELKAHRLKPGRSGHAVARRNLFAKTPDWSLSHFKSSREILDAFGYDRDGVRKLYCEVRSTRINPQGLKLEVDSDGGVLRERSDRPEWPEVAVWELSQLEGDLGRKHAETFWVGAESRMVNGVEQFRYVNVEHTQQPLLEQFAPLITAGAISLDHLIKRTEKGVKEKGPLFKLDNSASELLFPSPKSFVLSDLLQAKDLR